MYLKKRCSQSLHLSENRDAVKFLSFVPWDDFSKCFIFLARISRITLWVIINFFGLGTDFTGYAVVLGVIQYFAFYFDAFAKVYK